MPVKQSDFEFFLLQSGNGSTFHFSEYKTLDGVVHRLTETILPDGRTRYKRFHFNVGEPMVVHKSNKELLDFLTNHPNNPESPWFNGNALFKRLQPEVESKLRIEDKLLNAKAITLASELKGRRLLEVASLCGMFYDEEDEIIAFENVLTYAERNPKQFLKIYAIPNREARMRHLVRTAIGRGVITTNDGVYRFGSYTLGVDEDSTIGKIVNEKEVLEMIESRLGFLESDIEVKVEKPAPSVAPEPAQKEPEITMADINKYARNRKSQ